MSSVKLFENFLEQFPKMNECISKTKVISSYMMEIYYEDGAVGVFDSLLNTFRYIPEGNRPCMTEHRWQLELGQSIYRTMVEKGIQMNHLAEISGLSYSQLSKYINGHNTPSSYTLKRIATALGVEVGYLTSFERYYK